MGTRIITPPPSAPNDCSGCTIPAGSLWPAGENPDPVYVYFSGLVKCVGALPAPPNGTTFTLHQSPGNFCLWQTVGANWDVRWEPFLLFPNRSRVTLLQTAGTGFFVGTGAQCPAEPTIYSNLNVSCAFPVGSIFGFAMVVTQIVINQLIVDYNIPSVPDLFYEMFVKDGITPVHKFCNADKNINIKFEVP